MCFGVHCRGGRYGKTFTYDPKGPIDARRKAAGCGGNNRCSTTLPWKGQNLSCDEFPFANVREADQGGQNNRCVPAGENNSKSRKMQSPDLVAFLIFKNRPGRYHISLHQGEDRVHQKPAAFSVQHCLHGRKQDTVLFRRRGQHVQRRRQPVGGQGASCQRGQMGHPVPQEGGGPRAVDLQPVHVQEGRALHLGQEDGGRGEALSRQDGPSR